MEQERLSELLSFKIQRLVLIDFDRIMNMFQME